MMLWCIISLSSEDVDVHAVVVADGGLGLLQDAHARPHGHAQLLQPLLGQVRQLQQPDLGVLEGRGVLLVPEVLWGRKLQVLTLKSETYTAGLS